MCIDKSTGNCSGWLQKSFMVALVAAYCISIFLAIFFVSKLSIAHNTAKALSGIHQPQLPTLSALKCPQRCSHPLVPPRALCIHLCGYHTICKFFWAHGVHICRCKLLKRFCNCCLLDASPIFLVAVLRFFFI